MVDRLLGVVPLLEGVRDDRVVGVGPPAIERFPALAPPPLERGRELRVHRYHPGALLVGRALQRAVVVGPLECQRTERRAVLVIIRPDVPAAFAHALTGEREQAEQHAHVGGQRLAPDEHQALVVLVAAALLGALGWQL